MDGGTGPESIPEPATDALLVVDSDNRLIYHDKMASRLMGLDLAACLGESLPAIAARAGWGAGFFPSSGCLENGTQHWPGPPGLSVEVAALPPLPGSGGQLVRLRRSVEPPLAGGLGEMNNRVGAQLKAMFDSSEDGIWVCDHQGRIMDINRAAEELNGISAASVVGHHVTELMDSGLFDVSVTMEVLRTRKRNSLIQHIKGTGRTLLLTGTPVFGERGEIILVVINERDMTQLNDLKNQLEQSRLVTEKYQDQLTELNLLDLKKQEIVAESPEMRQVLRIALKLARLDASDILILGESGTGKGLLSKFIHQNSVRRDKPFIQINCAALPESLLEAELFGYERGAFTGAGERGKAGLFELAHGGTLFLDEIGDMPLVLQSKILKYLDDHEVFRLGGLKGRIIECTVIAATNRPLERLANQGRFRADLYYRLSTFAVRVPPLRERPEDILELTKYFLNKCNRQYGCQKKLGWSGFEMLQTHGFPGNVRELKNIIHRTVVMSDVELLDDSIRGIISAGGLEKPREDDSGPEPSGPDLTDKVMSLEKEWLRQALGQCRTTREMARYLGISQSTVVRKLRRHGLSRFDSSRNRDEY